MDFNRESFPFHRAWYNAICQLDPMVQLEVYKAIMRKAFYNERPQLSAVGMAAMAFIEPQIEQDTDKWIEIREKRKASGSKGGQTKQANATKSKQMVANATMEVTEKPKRKTFVKPTVEEVAAYIKEKGYNFDAEAFCAFYESKGWVVGKTPMKNWRMACITWAKNRNNNNSSNYGRETITDKIKRTVENATEFKQRIDANIGKQANMDFGDSDEVW